MDDITRIENKIDKISDKISFIDTTLAAQHVSLKDHIRRTEILEAIVGPLKTKSYMLKGILQFIGSIASVIAFVAAVAEILSYLKGPHV